MKMLYFHVYLSAVESVVLKFQSIETDAEKNLRYWSVDDGKKYRNRWLPISFENNGFETAAHARSAPPVILGLKQHI